jgi:hypothetical protein
MDGVLDGLTEMNWNVLSGLVTPTAAPLTDLLTAAVRNGLVAPEALAMLACRSPGLRNGFGEVTPEGGS